MQDEDSAKAGEAPSPLQAWDITYYRNKVGVGVYEVVGGCLCMFVRFVYTLSFPHTHIHIRTHTHSAFPLSLSS